MLILLVANSSIVIYILLMWGMRISRFCKSHVEVAVNSLETYFERVSGFN